jgi:hypothetical protein
MQQLLDVEVLINQHAIAEIQSFTRTLVGILCGFEAVADFEIARLRLSQLASTDPGEYLVFDLASKQVLVSPGEHQ